MKVTETRMMEVKAVKTLSISECVCVYFYLKNLFYLAAISTILKVARTLKNTPKPFMYIHLLN